MLSKTEFERAVREIARHYNGRNGEFAYLAFDYLNATFFDGGLPTPLIVWTITRYGACLGQTTLRPHSTRRPPVIELHPALMGGSTTDSPWGLEPALLGGCYALETLLHECMHVAVDRLWGGLGDYHESSHNCTNWCAETNRVAAMLGFEGFDAQPTRPRRTAIETDERTVRGKVPSHVVRATEGNIDLTELARFPLSTRQRLGLDDYYRRDVLPFTWLPDGRTTDPRGPDTAESVSS